MHGQFTMEQENNGIRQVTAINHLNSSVLDAMKDGWRVIQFPQQFPAYPGMEYQTAYLKFEYILERLEEIDG